jgi:tetratricopeptide (TPR) repeat protein
VREYIVDRDIKTNLFRLDPANNERREDLAASEAALGKTLYQCGETKAAEKHLRSAMESLETLLQVDPQSTDWLDEAGNYGSMLAEVLRALGNQREAEELDKAAISRLTGLVRKDGGNVGWQRKLALAYAEDARRALQGDQVVAANDSIRAAAAALRMAGSQEGLANQLAQAQIQLAAGDIAEAAGDSAKAHAAWTSARDAIASPATNSKDPALLDAWIGIRLRLEESLDVNVEAQTLIGRGYRNPDFIAAMEKYGISIPVRDAPSERIAQLANQPANVETNTD